MARSRVLLEVKAAEPRHHNGFEAFSDAMRSESEGYTQVAAALSTVAGLGVEAVESPLPVPMFSSLNEASPDFSAFSERTTNADAPAKTLIVPVEVERARIDDVRARDGVVAVWPSSPLSLFGEGEPGSDTAQDPGAVHTFDMAPSVPRVDCRPFRPAVEIDVIREMLGVSALWQSGFRGQNVVVGIIDEGINGTQYPVAGGFSRPGASRPPGSAAVTSHGSMCAADVLVAAPAARLYDYPFLGVPDSGGALAMFQAVLDQRRTDGTPHLTTNSYGFVLVPPREENPGHEIYDINHPLHRKVREVVASGAAVFFAAGNCGAPCASQGCDASGTGPGKSIHASNSLAEVITVASVNSRHERIGSSAQGPGMFAPQKPDFATYSHFFGNFGPGRPGGTAEADYDSGTSASAPLAAGAAALLLSAFPALTPDDLRNALMAGLVNTTGAAWDPDYGRGILNIASSYSQLLHKH